MGRRGGYIPKCGQTHYECYWFSSHQQHPALRATIKERKIERKNGQAAMYHFLRVCCQARVARAANDFAMVFLQSPFMHEGTRYTFGPCCRIRLLFWELWALKHTGNHLFVSTGRNTNSFAKTTSCQMQAHSISHGNCNIKLLFPCKFAAWLTAWVS